MQLSQILIFDAHLHIIDPRYALVENNGFLPEPFSCDAYLSRMKPYRLLGGAIVSGSFQAFDQTYLLDALRRLGSGYVGVTQLPVTVPDAELESLHAAGVRAIRFNLRRGGSEDIREIDRFARRVYELNSWHVELYADTKDLGDLTATLMKLPSVSIDHLGLSREGLPTLLKLVEKGIRVKATGFGRVDFDVPQALRDLYSANPAGLLFGTDLPSTRAPRPYSDNDYILIVKTLGEPAARKVLYENALAFYRMPSEHIQGS